MEEATSYALFFLSPFPMSWNGSSSESVVAMELAIRRELAFRAGQTQRGPQSLQSTPQQLQLPNQNSPSPPLPPPASAAMVDSLLCKRGLERKRLRDAAMELGFSRTTRPTIPVEIAMKREMAFRRLVEGAERRGLEQWPLMLCSGEAAQSSASSFGGEMAPKSSKGKRPAASTSSFDTERFQNAECAERFNTEFKERTIIFERIVVHTDFCLTGFLHWIQLNRLMVLINLINECFKDWVREFYCNMYEVTATGFKTYVRGKTLSVDSNKIATLLNLRRPANPSYPFPNPDNVALQKDEVATALCGNPTVWNSSALKISGLTTDYRLLNTFVCHNIEPRGHSSDLLFHQAALLYYLGTGTSVDVALTIFNSMLRIYDETRKLTLPFGAMICKLLIEAGCQVHPHELSISKRQKIDSRTRSMSESHVPNNHLQGERARVQADEDDEDSIENRLLAIEHAVYDLSLQIEQLEDKVTSGFADLRNQLNEMFNHLRQH